MFIYMHIITAVSQTSKQKKMLAGVHKKKYIMEYDYVSCSFVTVCVFLLGVLVSFSEMGFSIEYVIILSGLAFLIT